VKLEITSDITESRLLFGMNHVEYRITHGEREVKGNIEVCGLYRTKAVIAMLESVAHSLATLAASEGPATTIVENVFR